MAGMALTALPEPEVFKLLGTSASGLSPEEASQRLASHGPNSLEGIGRAALAGRLLKHFTHFLALLLWVAAGLAFFTEALHPGEGMATLGWAIVAVVVVNAVFSFAQEYRAERAVRALRQLLPDAAWVIRAGQTRSVPRRELVPGDLLLVEEGARVPADARLIEVVNLRVDNSSLTGESAAKARRTEPLPEPPPDPLQAPNLIFAGTTVLSGHGRAVVYATGLKTEFGKIAHLATTVQPGLSPLQHEIRKVTHVIALFATVMGSLFFLVGMLMGRGFWVSFVFAVGIIVANVPEGLLPTVTLALAIGSQRMARRRALIKQLTSVETLGCTTVICTDKTGTLTENRMRVDRLYVDGQVLEVRDGHLLQNAQPVHRTSTEPWQPLFDAMALCNNARLARGSDGVGHLTGDPTEVALLEFARRHGAPEPGRAPRLRELPFDADRKRMTTLHWREGTLLAYVKGAPEMLLPLCSHIHCQGRTRVLGSEEREAILAQCGTLAGEAYRVLAMCQRELAPGPARLEIEPVERDLTFLGLVALIDPPHAEVPAAIARCRQAGIRVIMITGDHPHTALAVARLIGLAPSAASPRPDVPLIEGREVDGLSDERLKRVLGSHNPDQPDVVFARMSPRHKLRVVSVLKAMGEVVAVTGDGVNDAPALQKADIGIAMGKTGTDVAKETADMILLDDNFTAIVNAIEEGRTVYANIRKFVTYVLSSNVPEIVPYLGYALLPIPLPLTVPQILAVDLGTDIMPALALGAEPPHPGSMTVPPRSRSERLLNAPLLLRAYGFLGVIEAMLAMGAFFWFLDAHGWTWGTPLDWSDPLYQQATSVTLAAIVVAQIGNIFACRSEHHSSLALGLLTNRYLLWGIGVEVALLGLMIYTPQGRFILGTGPLPGWVWGPLLLGAGGLLLLDEGRKLVVRLWTNRNERPASQP